MMNFEERKAEIFRRSNERIKKNKRRRNRIVFTLLPVALCLCVLSAVVIPKITVADKSSAAEIEAFIDERILKFPQKTEDATAGVNDKSGEKDTVTKSESVEYEYIAVIPDWDSLSVFEQYNSLDFSGVTYSGRSTEIPEELLESRLGELTVSGYDGINNQEHTKKACVYSIKNISSQCAVAVELEGKYYAYTNAFYKPATLGDFIEDLKLKENLTFGTVTYSFDNNNSENYIYGYVEFPDVSSEKIWEILLSDTELANVHSDEAHYESKVIGISVSLPLLGYKNIGIWITEDGYMHTNILDTGKTFYIGKEKTEEFLNYLIDNCDGVRSIFHSEDESDDGGSGEDSSASTSSVAQNP